MKRPSYRAALEWIALNDDTTWLEDGEDVPSVTLVLIADLFDVPETKAIVDLKRTLARLNT